MRKNIARIDFCYLNTKRRLCRQFSFFLFFLRDLKVFPVSQEEILRPKRQQGSDTTRNKMRCSQGVAMIFEDAYVVFSRFLSLKSRGCALLETHRQRETTGIKKLYNSFFVMF